MTNFCSSNQSLHGIPSPFFILLQYCLLFNRPNCQLALASGVVLRSGNDSEGLWYSEARTIWILSLSMADNLMLHLDVGDLYPIKFSVFSLIFFTVSSITSLFHFNLVYSPFLTHDRAFLSANRFRDSPWKPAEPFRSSASRVSCQRSHISLP